MYDYREENYRKFNAPFVVTLVLLVFTAIGFFLYHSQASSTISTNINNISNLKDQVSSAITQLTSASSQASSLGDQLSTANTQISTLKNQVSGDTAQISSLQNQLTSSQTDLASLQNQLATSDALTSALQNHLAASNTQVNSLQTQLTSANSKITTLQTQLTSANSQAGTLQSQLSASSSQINALQNQVSSLNSQIQALQSGSTSGASTQITGSLSIGQSYGQQPTVATFTASSAGSLYINGSSTSSTGYVRIVNSNYGTTTNYAMGLSSSTITIPVQPGSISIYFGNSDASATSTATFSSITFTPSSSTSAQITGSLSIGQSVGQQSSVTSFTASTAGSLVITGYCTSSTGYIRTVNSNSGASSNYGLGLSSSTITIPVQPGSISIYFGNSDASVTSTATFSSIVYSHS